MIFKKGNTIFALLAFLIILIFVFLWWWSRKGGNLTNQSVSRTPAFQSTSDLDSASKQLDSTDLNQMDADINRVASDASNF